jgi:hypothetical protein
MNFGQDTLQVVEIKLDNRNILWLSDLSAVDSRPPGYLSSRLLGFFYSRTWSLASA